MKMGKRTRYLVGFCISMFSYSHMAIAHDLPQIVLSAPEDPALAERGVITLTLSNPTDERIAIVSAETPFATETDHLANVQFQVTDAANKELSYRGRNVNFGPPDPTSFFVLEPHETRQKNVDIAREYGISVGGPYKVTYVKNLRVLRSSGIQRISSIRPGDDIPIESVRSNTLTIWINDSLIRAQRSVSQRQAAMKVETVATCTDPQLSTLAADLSIAEAQASAALNHLALSYTYDTDANGIPTHGHNNDPRYIYWFGTYDSTVDLTSPTADTSDNGVVDQVMVATYLRLGDGLMTFSCGCPGYPASTKAWTETGLPYLVHICDKYWTDPATGGSPLPSRAGNLVHEASHFNDSVATGTGDNYYTSPEAHAAAATARSTAVRTAVNYEYYIMNAAHP